jgi:hypothetical protein
MFELLDQGISWMASVGLVMLGIEYFFKSVRELLMFIIGLFKSKKEGEANE